MLAAATEAWGSTVIALGGSSSLTLSGVALSTLSSDDFLLAA